MFKHWQHGYFPLPFLLSVLEWSLFSLYWRAEAKKSSRAVSSETSGSRRLHVILVNAGLLLIFFPVRGLGPRFLPGTGWTAWLGLSIQSVSVMLAVWARRHLGAHWSGAITIKVGHELIRSGPYRFVRHPIYVAILGMFAGAAVVSGTLLAVLAVILVAFAYWRKIRLEEANLRRAFGRAYDVYQHQIGALIPKYRAREHDP